MLKIGDFSTLARVTVKTLRYYDEMGLLQPSFVDHETGYRYYSVTLLPRLHRILVLKDMGFPLEQIAKMLEKDLNLEELKGMFVLRAAEQEERVREEQARLARVRDRLSLIEKEKMMPKDVVIKEIPAQWIASIRDVIPSYSAVGMLYGELVSVLGASLYMGNLPVALWHDEGYKESDVDAEAGFYLKEAIPAKGRAKVYQLPAVTVASLVHNGAYNRLSQAYDELLRWIGGNGYRICGPERELYLKSSQPVSIDDESYITEIQVPIAK